jgi:hypothetical protein
MDFFKNIFTAKSSSSSVSSSSSDNSSINSQSTVNSHPEWNKATTIKYGSVGYKPTKKYHDNHGYFNKKTEVANDQLYQKEKIIYKN